MFKVLLNHNRLNIYQMQISKLYRMALLMLSAVRGRGAIIFLKYRTYPTLPPSINVCSTICNFTFPCIIFCLMSKQSDLSSSSRIQFPAGTSSLTGWRVSPSMSTCAQECVIFVQVTEEIDAFEMKYSYPMSLGQFLAPNPLL